MLPTLDLSQFVRRKESYYTITTQSIITEYGVKISTQTLHNALTKAGALMDVNSGEGKRVLHPTEEYKPYVKRVSNVLKWSVEGREWLLETLKASFPIPTETTETVVEEIKPMTKKK